MQSQSDVYNHVLVYSFCRRWLAELKNAREAKRKPSLFKTVFRTFILEYFILGCIQALNEFVLRYANINKLFSAQKAYKFLNVRPIKVWHENQKQYLPL